MWGALSTGCVGVARLRVTLTAALDQLMQRLLPAEEMNREELYRSGEGSFCCHNSLDTFHLEVRGRAHHDTVAPSPNL